MAKYTVEFGNLIRMGFKPFDDSWQTFIPEHKSVLQQKFIDRYFFNEIGAETPERFKFYLNEQIRRQIPVWNKLYESELWKLYPLANTVLNTNVHGVAQDSDIRDNIVRRDTAAIREFGESLHHDLKDDEWTKFDQNVHGVTNQTGNLTGTHDETEHTDKDGTRVYKKENDNIMDESSERDIKEVTNSKEVMDDDTTKNTTGNETRNTTSSHWSSDTPQGRVVNNQLSIDAQFLTNYSHDTESMTRNYTENVTGTDDRTTDFDKTVTTDDDLVRKVTEDNEENYDEKYHETIDRSKHNDDVEDTTGWKDENTDTDATTHRTLDTLSHDFKQNLAQDNGTDVTAASGSGQSSRQSDTLTTVEGSSGVSKVRLLVQYREAIINIDEIILDALAENFMGVF